MSLDRKEIMIIDVSEIIIVRSLINLYFDIKIIINADDKNNKANAVLSPVINIKISVKISSEQNNNIFK